MAEWTDYLPQSLKTDCPAALTAMGCLRQIGLTGDRLPDWACVPESDCETIFYQLTATCAPAD